MSERLKQTGAVVRWEGGGTGGEVRLVTMVATIDEAAAAVVVAVAAVAASTLVSRTVTSCSSRVTSPSSHATLTFASAGTCARAPACELCVEANKIEGQ